MSTLALLAALAAGGWFVFDGLRAREMVLAAARRGCEDLRVQFLDETVALARVRLARDADGRVRVQRHYAFEFSADGMARLPGAAITLGARLEVLRLDLADGPVHIAGSDNVRRIH